MNALEDIGKLCIDFLFCFCKNNNFHVWIKYLSNAKCPHGKENIIIWVLPESVTINGVILEGGYLYVM